MPKLEPGARRVLFARLSAGLLHQPQPVVSDRNVRDRALAQSGPSRAV